MSTKKVLWLDDHINRPELRQDREELESAGFSIIPAVDVETFVSKISATNDYDVIIIDLSIAVGKNGTVSQDEAKFGTRTGFVLLKLLLEDIKYCQSFKDVKKVVYTAVDASEVRAYCKDNDIPYFDKSEVMPDELVEKIESLLK